MTKKEQENLGKYIALILRHKPEVIGIALDEHGWANVSDLIKGINKTQHFTMGMLEKIVEEVNKDLQSYKKITMVTVVDEPLPMTSTKKVKRFEVVKKFKEA